MTREVLRTTFGKLAKLRNERANPSDLGKEVPYLGLEHFAENGNGLLSKGLSKDVDSQKSKFHSGDILYGKLRPYFRKVFMPNFDGICSTEIWVVIPREGIDRNYLKWIMTSKSFTDYAMSGATGTRMPRAVWEHVSRMPVSLPNLREQIKFAEILDSIEDLIELNEELIESLRAQVRTLFDQLMMSLGQTVMPLFEVFSIDFGGAFRGEHFTQPGVGLPLIRIRDLKTFESAIWTTERIEGDVLVIPGELLIGMDAEFRPTYWLGEPSLMNQRVCRVRPKIGSLAFAMEALIKPMAFIEGHKTGTTVSHLNKADFEVTKISVPNKQALKRFDEVAEELRLAVIALTSENKVLRSTRDELLPLLLSGVIKVKDDSA